MKLGLLGLMAALSLSAVAADCSKTPFGAANGFNLFVLEDLVTSNSNTEGAIAVGRDASFVHYSIGHKLTTFPTGVPYTLVVGQRLYGRHGHVWKGPVAYGTWANVDETFTMIDFPYHTLPVDFTRAGDQLRATSERWEGLKSEGSLVKSPGALKLVGTRADLNVFNVTSEELAAVTFLEVDAPEGATILVNVSGETAQIKEFGFKTERQIVFNFPRVRELELKGVGVPGVVYAPRAEVTFNDGHVTGTLVAKSMKGGGHLRVGEFKGCLP
jgi:choice-of-anchor A domain-containing protein